MISQFSRRMAIYAIVMGLACIGRVGATEIPKNAWLGDTFSDIGWREGFVASQPPEINRTDDRQIVWRSGTRLGVFDSRVTGDDPVNHDAASGVVHFSYFDGVRYDSALCLPIPDGVKVFRAGVDVRPFDVRPDGDASRKPPYHEQYIGLILMPVSTGNWFARGSAPLRIGIDCHDPSAYHFIVVQRGQPPVLTPVKQLRNYRPDQFNHIEIVVNLNHGTVLASFNGARVGTIYKLKDPLALKCIGIEAMPGTKFTSGYADNFYIAPPGGG